MLGAAHKRAQKRQATASSPCPTHSSFLPTGDTYGDTSSMDYTSADGYGSYGGRLTATL